MEYVVGFMFDEELQSVVLIKKNRPEWQKGKFNGIGGKIETSRAEKPYSAMVREFEEETGYLIVGWIQFTILEGDNYSLYCFYAVGDIQKVGSKTDEMVFITPIAHLEHYNVIPNLKWLIPMALNHLNRVDTGNYIIYEQ